MGTTVLVSPVSYAYCMALGDERGNVYVFDFVKNEFWLLARSGVSISTMKFNIVRRRELIICLSDSTIQCYNIGKVLLILDTCQMIAKLPNYHRSPPTMLSVHPSKPLVISSCQEEAVLWDSEKWERIRILSGDAGLQQVVFSPDGLAIVAAFQDGNIFFWTIESYSLLWKISLSQLAGPFSEVMADIQQYLLASRYSHFSISSSGEFFVYGGLSSTIYVWNLYEKRLVHEILIPIFKEKLLIQIEFVGNTNVIALLSNQGELILIDAEKAKFLGQVRTRHSFKNFSISPDGLLFSTILMDQKYQANLFRVDPLLSPDEEPDIHPDENEATVTKPVPQPRVQKIVEPPKTFYQLIESKQDATYLNRAKLRGFLNFFGSYPEKYRPMIWRYLLKLPENRGAYEAFLDQGTHPSYKNFRKDFPLKSDRISRSMEKVLSCLAFWSPIFENLDYLPSIVFPFVKLFLSDMFSCLEVVMTVLVNWCQKWWEYYPNPPIECLNVLEQMLGFHDPELHRHFVQLKLTSQTYGWLILQTLFSEVFSKNDWLILWDHLVSNQPSFIYYVIVAYLVRFRKPLLETSRLGDFEFFFQRRNPVNINSVVLLAYKFSDTTPSSLAPGSFMAGFTPLLRGEYPVFNKYPEFIVNYQSKMKEKIRREEDEYTLKRRTTEELVRLTQQLQKDKEAWDSQDWKMNEMVEKWWDQMLGQESMRSKQREKLDMADKEQKAIALDTIAQLRRSFLDNQTNATEKHIANMAKAVGQNQASTWKQVQQTDFDKSFNDLEQEWKSRREELLGAQKTLEKIQQERIQRLVDHVKDISPADDHNEQDKQVGEMPPPPSRQPTPNPESPTKDSSASPTKASSASPTRTIEKRVSFGTADYPQ